ncbi:bifunctional precorrin-2 dehydrogenase/sirohydrochlorin ferrochelatase [Bacillus sp. JCM 19034]|uniref:precorrin-2 dehydrogenase/sirohydrochlorin ferrochelatase family protein n=1 Tax=Bacillus sp. JCM 19034 TaxID=1481928 RepID=UPI00078082E2|nr:NAD(P)-dependent oxidoreductase [Bacillus sp. JCM 19034]
MQRLPIFLSLTNKHAVIVGGGHVAVRHVKKLLSAQIKQITIYSPTIDDELKQLVIMDHVKWVREKIEKPRSFAADLVLLVTSDKELNKQLYDMKAPYQLMYVASDQNVSDIHFPTTITRGNLTISLSTNGSSPIYAKRMKSKIEDVLHDQIEEDLDFLQNVRTRLKEMELSSTTRKKILHIVAAEEILQMPDRLGYVEALIERVKAEESKNKG